jgi:hypothetical protein
MKIKLSLAFITALTLSTLCMQSHAADADAVIDLTVQIPDLDASPYFRPYVAIWLETPERKSVTTLALWYQIGAKAGGEGNGDQWLKDLRQWWRKTGRSAGDEIDAVTSATKKPSNHELRWDGLDNKGELVAAGEYMINFEASREDGGREFLRQKIVIGESNSFVLQGSSEFGTININTHE